MGVVSTLTPVFLRSKFGMGDPVCLLSPTSLPACLLLAMAGVSYPHSVLGCSLLTEAE